MKNVRSHHKRRHKIFTSSPKALTYCSATLNEAALLPSALSDCPTLSKAAALAFATARIALASPEWMINAIIRIRVFVFEYLKLC